MKTQSILTGFHFVSGLLVIIVSMFLVGRNEVSISSYVLIFMSGMIFEQIIDTIRMVVTGRVNRKLEKLRKLKEKMDEPAPQIQLHMH